MAARRRNVVRTKSVICRGQARTIEDAVKAWKAEHDDAMEVRDIEDVVRVCVLLSELMQEWQAEAWECLFSGKLRSTQLAGGLLRKAYAHAAEAFEGVAEWVNWVRERGYKVEGARRFTEAVEAVRRLREDFVRRWPTLTASDLAEGSAQAARGEFMSPEELARELTE
jgi:hypothetical protein